MSKTPRQGLSLHIGLKNVDSTKYHDREGKPWNGALPPCEVDARDMAALASSQGFVPTLLLTADATSEGIFGRIRQTAEKLTEGDMFLLTFSGHGGSIPDTNGDESDGRDETWVAYDRQVADDEIYQELTRFSPGVRVFIASDSCHSGTVSRRVAAPDWTKAKALPKSVEDADETVRAELYEQIQRSVPDARLSVERLGAEVLLISACTDGQLAYVGPRHSVFTGVLLRTWDKGRFQGTYRDFYEALQATMPSNQTPQWTAPADVDPPFSSQRPFTI